MFRQKAMQLIQPIKKNEDLILEMDSLLDDQDHYHLWWLGQSGFLLQWKNHRILIDPYLSDSLTRKYAGTDKPHIRISERVIEPGMLKNISIVTSSHNHTDHLDAETLQPVIANNPGIRFIIPEANREFAATRLQCSQDFFIGLTDGESKKINEFAFHGIPAKHNEIERDENGNSKFMGYIIEFGGEKIYHSGDTLWFDDLVKILRPFKPDIALLPINGDDPVRGVAGNLNGTEAVRLSKEIHAGMVIPCHYDMFAFNTADPGDFEREASLASQTYRILKIGERFSGKFSS